MYTCFVIGFNYYSVLLGMICILWTILQFYNMNRTKNMGNTKLFDGILDKRSNLNGVVVRYSWFHNPPFVRFARDGSGNVIGYSGFYVDLFMELQNKLQFTGKYVPPKPKEKWGAKTKNGSWNGMVGMLIRDEIDYSGIGCGINAQRQSVVDFSFPTRGNLFTLMIASTDKPKLNVWAYIDVFPLKAWVMLLALIVGAALYFSFANREAASESFALMLRLSVQLSYSVTVRGTASKMALIVSAVTLNLIFIYYSCDLTATMTSAPQKIGISSFEDVKDLGYRVIFYGFGLRGDRYLKAAPEGSAMRWIYDNQIKGNDDAMFTDFKAMVRTAAEEPKTLLYWVYHPYSENFHEKQLKALDIQEKMTFYEGNPMQKNSEFRSRVQQGGN